MANTDISHTECALLVEVINFYIAYHHIHGADLEEYNHLLDRLLQAQAEHELGLPAWVLRKTLRRNAL